MGTHHARWLALGALTAGLALLSASSRSEPATAPIVSGLAPDATVVRYKFAGGPPTSDLTSSIDAFEARRKRGIASPLDLAELAELYVRRAQVDGDFEDYQRSEHAARTSLAILPEPSGASLTLAKLANAQHEFRTAITITRERLTKTRDPATYTVLATAHLALGELAAASEAAEAAVDMRPDSGTYLMRALVMQAQGRDAEAAHDFSRAVATESHGDREEAARTRSLWARFLVRRGELAGAKQILDEVERIVPSYPLGLAQRAELALRSGTHKEAGALFERAFAASRQVRYLIDLARAQELGGDRAGAASSRLLVEKIARAELREHGFGHRLDLVEILVDRGTPADLAEAVTLAHEELTRRTSADTRFQLARALARSGRRDEAVVHVRAALASGTRDARLYELAARLETGARAEVYAREAERLDPGGSGWRGLGMGSAK